MRGFFITQIVFKSARPVLEKVRKPHRHNAHDNQRTLILRSIRAVAWKIERTERLIFVTIPRPANRGSVRDEAFNQSAARRREAMVGIEQLLVPPVAAVEAQFVHFAERIMGRMSLDMHTVQRTEHAGPLLADATMNQCGAAGGVAKDVEEQGDLVGGRRVAVVARQREKLDAASSADLTLLLLPGVGMGGVAAAAQGDNGPQAAAFDQMFQVGRRGLTASIQRAFLNCAKASETVVWPPEKASNEAGNDHSSRIIAVSIHWRIHRIGFQKQCPILVVIALVQLRICAF